jgi:hypothetical protein
MTVQNIRTTSGLTFGHGLVIESHIVIAVVVPVRFPDPPSSVMKEWKDSQTN